ncbi:MAG: LL-diaminopimelate aminotransferase [Chlamydiae bacterium]|nr:LL-diaminopimelate aminotransferase [Chlamydiota bacterium]
MSKAVPYFSELPSEYIFPIIEGKLIQLKEKFPDAGVLNLGIGDISLPLAPTLVKAICNAVEEMGTKEGMHGYGPSSGYAFLKEKIVEAEYKDFSISPDEIFISDGTNSDCVNLLELFSRDSIIAIIEPTYPAYLHSSIIAGRKNNLLLIACEEKTGFVPQPPDVACDIIYLCTPNNPTGVAMNYDELGAWVAYAKKHNAILIHDHAYHGFITSDNVPKSIYEIEGAKDIAIELKTFSKSAGFTGLRCAYSVIPKSIYAYSNDKKISIHQLWNKRQNIKSNGVAYPIQKGAEAFFTPQGQKETNAQIQTYLNSGKILREGLTACGYTIFGGVDAPYIWIKTPGNIPSWEFFDILLEKCHIIGIPGKGFGTYGEGYLRLSTFITEEIAKQAIQRIQKLEQLCDLQQI